MMPGGGLVLENIHPSQEGVYQCLAENKIGRVTAEARVTVRERPVLTVTPETRVQVRLPPLPSSHQTSISKLSVSLSVQPQVPYFDLINISKEERTVLV